MKSYKVLSYLGALSYIALGLLIIGSILNGSLGWHINLIVGLFFILVGYFLYCKARNIIKLMANIKDLNKDKQVSLIAIAHFIVLEKIFVVMSLLLGIIALSGAMSRVFGEKMSIFD